MVAKPDISASKDDDEDIKEDINDMTKIFTKKIDQNNTTLTKKMQQGNKSINSLLKGQQGKLIKLQ